MVLPKCKDRAKPPRFSIYKLISGIYIYIYMLLKKPILKSDKEKDKTLLEKKNTK